MRVRRCGGSTIWSLGILLLFAATSTAWGQCGVCDSGGICDSQVGITGGFAQVCNDGQWTSLAFPFNAGGAMVDTVTAVHNSNTGVGDIYIMGGTCGGPDVNNILATMCGVIVGQPMGVPVEYCFDPIFTSPVDPTWVVMVMNSSFSFDVAFNLATQALGTPGTAYGNLDGGPDPALWQDLVAFGFDACYCVDLSFTGCVTQPTGACCLPDGSCIMVSGPDCATAGGAYEGDGIDCGSVNCPPPSGPVNDFCANAIPIFDGDTPYSTIGATTDGLGHAACSFDGVTYADIWYTYTATCEGLLTVSTCSQADYDTDMAGYSLPAPCPPTDAELLACNDDGPGCAGFTSEMSFPVVLGSEYLIRVGGFNSDGDQGTGTITITCQATGGTCCIDGDTPEPEPCGDDLNGGCNGDPVAYGMIACGETVCGTSWAMGGTRDTDWYVLSHAGGVIEATLESEFPGVVFILTGPPGTCDTITVAADAASNDCVPGTASIDLPAGDYVIFAAPDVFDGYPCGSFNDYRLTVICPPPPAPTGACCLPDATCVNGVTEEDCFTMLMGTEWFQDALCEGGFVGYPESFSECGNAFFDITGTGTPLLLGDDAGENVGMGFSFNFYGESYDSLWVVSNGYLTFSGDDVSDFSNDQIPDPNLPNNIIAAFWDDLDPGNAGSPATVHYETVGDAPNRVFIAQWTDVPEFPDTGANTFQALLYENGGCIELRYGEFTADTSGTDVTIGIENQDGTAGVQMNAAMIVPGSCITICPDFGDPIDCPEAIILGSLIIKQGACPAPVNPNSNGVVPMALMGDAMIDVTQVMLDSLWLSRCDGMGEAVAPNYGPPGPGPKLKDINHPYAGELGCEGDGCACNDDESSDGILDLQLFFRTNDLYEAGILAGGMGDVVTVVLTGMLADGTEFEAADCIRLVQPGTPPGMVNMRSLHVKGAWMGVTPVDDQLDGGGFGEFYRTFPQGTIVSVSAEPYYKGKELIGWSVDGRPIAKHSTIAVVVIGESQTIEAIYGDGEGAGGLNEPTPPGPPTGDRPPSGQTPLIP